MPSGGGKLRVRLQSYLTRHWLLTLITMFCALICFGLTSYNIFFYLNANLRFLAENGLRGLAEGGLEQLVMLFLNGWVGIFSYLVFKACEKILVEKMVK